MRPGGDKPWLGEQKPDGGVFEEGAFTSAFTCLLLFEMDTKDSSKKQRLSNSKLGQLIDYQQAILVRNRQTRDMVYGFVTNNFVIRFIRMDVSLLRCCVLSSFPCLNSIVWLSLWPFSSSRCARCFWWRSWQASIVSEEQ